MSFLQRDPLFKILSTFEKIDPGVAQFPIRDKLSRKLYEAFRATCITDTELDNAANFILLD